MKLVDIETLDVSEPVAPELPAAKARGGKGKAAKASDVVKAAATPPFNAGFIFDAYMRAAPSPFDPIQRLKTVGASDVGGCIRRVAFNKNELDPVKRIDLDPDYVDSVGATFAGSTIEATLSVPAIRAWARGLGGHLIMAGDDQRTLVDGRLSATPDGLIIGLPADALASIGIMNLKDAPVVVEFKSIDPRVPLGGEPKIAHLVQVQVQMGLLRKLTPFKPDHAVILYVNRSFWSELETFAVAFDPAIYDSMVERANRVYTTDDLFELPAEGRIGGGKECKYCPWTRACAGIEIGAIPESDKPKIAPESAQRLTELARNYKSLAAAIDEAETARRTLGDEIKHVLKDNEIRRFAKGGVSVNWSAVLGRPAFDVPRLTEAAKAAGVDVADFEKVGSATDRLTVTVKQ